MSGGHWQYLQFKLEEHGAIVSEAMELLGAIEHILDWGISGDTCQDCAEIQTIAMLKAFFTEHASDEPVHTWQEIFKDDLYYCERHKKQ